MFVTLVLNVAVALFLSVKNILLKMLGPTLKLASFSKAVSVKTSLLMLFTDLCEILLLLIVFDHNFSHNKKFLKVSQPITTMLYVKAATETRNYYIRIVTTFTTFLAM